MPRPHKSLVRLNACPHCGDPMDSPPLPPGTTIGSCTSCGHLVGAMSDPAGAAIGTLGYDFLHKHFNRDALKAIHEKQEKLLHGLGLWG